MYRSIEEEELSAQRDVAVSLLKDLQKKVIRTVADKQATYAGTRSLDQRNYARYSLVTLTPVPIRDICHQLAPFAGAKPIASEAIYRSTPVNVIPESLFSCG